MADALFHIIADAHAVLRGKNGVWRQTKLYRRGDELFAGWGSGFIRLHARNGTSTPSIFLDTIVLPPGCETSADQLGRLTLIDRRNAHG